MTAPASQIRVGKTWLSTVAAWGDLVETLGRHGPLEATWSMALRNDERPSCLRRGALVELFSGAERTWAGTLSEPDWDGKQFAAIGIARQGEGAQCLNASGALTTKLNTAIDRGGIRGVHDWVRVDDFGNTDIAGPEGDSTHDDPEPGSIDELMNLWADEEDSQWYVHHDRRLVDRPEDESTPNWLILPGAGVLGVADDDVTDVVALRYLDSTSGRYRTAFYPASTPAGGIERRASVVHRGPMSSARATTIAQGIWKKAQAGRTGWLNGVDLVETQILTLGGLRANLARIQPGQTARMLDTLDPRTGRGHLDFVIADLTRRHAERRIQLNPVGLVKASFADILTDFKATEGER